MELLDFMLLLLLSFSVPVHGEVVGAVVMPHGGIALDPSHFNATNQTVIAEAWSLHNACVDVGTFVQNLAPDILLLSTPHGIADLTHFSFYLNSKGYGEAATDNCNCPPCCYNVSVDVDSAQSLSIINQLEMFGANVSGMYGYGDAEPFPLRWGEVIPLHFLYSSSLSPSVKAIILSQPNRRYTQSVEMIPELLTLGCELFALLEPLKERVVVVISADLAHTHLSSGPYGYSDAAEPFDQAIGNWASSLNSSELLVNTAGFVNKALSCGYTGLVMLQGFIEAHGVKFWQSKLHANYHPSYYGMMVASFEKKLH